MELKNTKISRLLYPDKRNIYIQFTNRYAGAIKSDFSGVCQQVRTFQIRNFFG